MGNFTKQVKQWNKKAKSAYRFTARTAVQTTVSLAQEVRDNGGRMRVVTGFLRASIQGNINSMPKGPSSNEKDKKYGLGQIVAGEAISVTLLKWDPLSTDSIFVGWTANYARPREYYDGFLRGAVEKWDRTVDVAALKAKNSGF